MIIILHLHIIIMWNQYNINRIFKKNKNISIIVFGLEGINNKSKFYLWLFNISEILIKKFWYSILNSIYTSTHILA